MSILAVGLAACSTAATPAPTPAPTVTPAASATVAGSQAVAAPPASLTVFAAASLTATIARVKSVYEAANPGTTLTISTDSSAALATKIEQGAPVDVFLSADTANPQKLADKSLTDGGVKVFAGNVLTIIVPTANPAKINDPVDLAKAGVKVITCADNVPIAKYTQSLIANLAKQTGYPSDYAARYTANIASKESNVTAIVTKIELGEGDAGVVYATDAKASTKVTAIKVPDWANVPASYGGVVVRASKNTASAQAFMAWLTGKAGQAVLSEFGFLPPA